MNLNLFKFPLSVSPSLKSIKRFLVVASYVASLLGLGLAPLQSTFARQNQNNAATPLPLDQLRLFAEVFEQVKHNYVEPVDDKRLLTAAIKGMVASLDPHSSYLDENDYRELQEQTRGRFAGIGIEISPEEGLIKVISPIEDTPAFRVNIRPGDLIVRIDGKPVRGMMLDKAVKLMRGKPGTKVTLTLYRKTDNQTFPVTVTRAEIHVKSVKTKLIQPGYLWVRITTFQENTVPELADKLKTILQRSALHGLILDLRNNGGGLLQSAVGVAGVFLPSNVVIVSTNGQDAEAKETYRNIFDHYRLPSFNNDPLKTLSSIFKSVPMVVLTNAYSASASEIVAGALQDHHRAIIMGKTTFGKGSVQTVRPLTSKTALRLTSAYYYTPSGRSIQNKGIRPDQPVDQNAEGDPDDVFVSRETDYSNHLANIQDGNESKEKEEYEKEQIEQLRRMEEENAKKTPEQREKERTQVLPEFGSDSDFMLQQALHQLKGKPVQRSKSPFERKTNEPTTIKPNRQLNK